MSTIKEGIEKIEAYEQQCQRLLLVFQDSSPFNQARLAFLSALETFLEKKKALFELPLNTHSLAVNLAIHSAVEASNNVTKTFQAFYEILPNIEQLNTRTRGVTNEHNQENR